MLDYSFINREQVKIHKLEDEVEKQIRLDLLDRIIEQMNDYDVHIKEYEYSKKRNEAVSRGVNFVANVENANDLKERWINMFTTDIDDKVKEEIYFNSFLWHIFSYRKLIAKTGQEAREMFNNCNKNTVYIFYQHSEVTYFINNPQKLLASDFDLEEDIYVFDVKEKWTYIHTHEQQCGPYFYRT
ncbi:DUF4275 family protein [Clostridiaceae bacterium M8S5]|nr:DUF4275 family protein [Clostridiaceae bacterium M8S5]